MNLSKRLTGDFSATVRNRARTTTGRPRAHPARFHAQVDARVRGSRSYEVSLDWEDGVLFASCDCAHFESEPCKIFGPRFLSRTRAVISRPSPRADVILDCAASRMKAGEMPASKLKTPPWRRRNHHRRPLEEPQHRHCQSGFAGRPACDEWPGKRESYSL